YRNGYGQISQLAGLPVESVHGFLVEQFLTGAEVTLEGYVFDGRVTTIGVTDSPKYPGTNSFERFEYPSALPLERQRELADIAEVNGDLEVLVRPGLWLSEQGTNDPESYRLAIFSEWAETREEALARCRARAAALPFELK